MARIDQSFILQIIESSLAKYNCWFVGGYLYVSPQKRSESWVFTIWERGDFVCLNKTSNQIHKADPQLLPRIKETLENAFRTPDEPVTTATS